MDEQIDIACLTLNVTSPMDASDSESGAVYIHGGMPRLAPVTSAILPCKSNILPSYYCNALSNVSAVLIAVAVKLLSIRFDKPVNTLPGPHSTICETPSPASF